MLNKDLDVISLPNEGNLYIMFTRNMRHGCNINVIIIQESTSIICRNVKFRNVSVYTA